MRYMALTAENFRGHLKQMTVPRCGLNIHHRRVHTDKSASNQAATRESYSRPQRRLEKPGRSRFLKNAG